MPRATERVGRSGEYLVASILARACDTVLIVPHSANADIIFEHNNKLYRCQVKTQSKISNNRVNWRFDMRKGHCQGYSKNNRRYEDNSLDVFALVSLQHRNVVFTLPLDQSQLTIVDEHMKSNDAVKNIENILESLS